MLLLKDCMFKSKEPQDDDGDEGVKVSQGKLPDNKTLADLARIFFSSDT